MERLEKTRLFTLLIFGLLLLMVVSAPGARAQEDGGKKYASILGDYEFDMSSVGLGVMVITFYMEEGELLVVTETSSEPGKLEPIQVKELAFTVEDPDEGTYTITFLKDETGKYTKCRIENENLNLDVKGKKI